MTASPSLILFHRTAMALDEFLVGVDAAQLQDHPLALYAACTKKNCPYRGK